MANVQKQFETFHKVIRMDYDANSELAEKRDILVKKIKKYLEDNKKPSCEVLLQGSYIMKTGVKPIEELEHDIDVGLRFYIKTTDYTAVDARKWVFEAVKKHTDEVRQMPSCIRVAYEKGYHVDLVVYAVEEKQNGEEFYLAHKDKGWRPADPIGLLNHVSSINEKYEDTEDSLTSTTQFRRVIRYLKRWDDEANPTESSAKPSGLAFTLTVAKYASGPHINGSESDDRSLLYEVANKVSNIQGRIQISKPTPEYEDLFAKLSDAEMETLKKRFKDLKQALLNAQTETSVKKACGELKKQLGRDFPVPDDDKEAASEKLRTTAPAILRDDKRSA